ncbi:unnamed protein product [Ambrosiozyma monospora]|uniref:Unnamed protein product n=1 Tax=Ambrosiozyma monospora TaxID=43982 RepID=A0ACB5TDE6_AMBMO|nr:unnamed protein product [Ambrosiozyma monospora]
MLGDELLTTVHTSEHWNPINWEDVKEEHVAYAASKTYAEKAARKFVADNKVNFKLATVNPPFVLGPQLFESSVKETLNTSNEGITAVLRLDKTLTTPLKQPLGLAVDVRDVAAFHILPLEVEQLAEQRQFIVAGKFVAQLTADILNKNFPQLNGKIVKGDPSSEKELLEKFTPKYDVSDVLAKAGGYKLIDVETSIVDTVSQYLKHNTF